jgi:pimeloyl-ACP methyl ester carboxylesterase
MQFLKCCFGCLTCCGSCHSLTFRLTFQAPCPPSYTIREVEGKLKLIFKNREGEEIEPEIFQALEEKVEFIENSLGSRLPVYYLQHPDSAFTIICSHGNSSDIGHMVYKAMDLVLYLGVNVLLYEYTGYGLSSGGRPTEQTAYSDIRAAFAYVTEHLRVPWHKVILYGQSLGSGPTIDLAAEVPVGGVILHSPFASVLLILAKTQTSSPSFDIFRNIMKIGKLKCPVFYLHGTEDRVVPIRNCEWLYSSTHYKYPPWWVEGGDHNRIEIDFRADFYIRLRDFMKHLEELQLSLEDREITKIFTPRPQTTEVPNRGAKVFPL